MRRLVSSVVVALGLVGTGLAVLPAPALAAGKKVCTIEDSKLDELSGLVATGSGYIAINDSSNQSNRKRVFYLDSKCAVTKNVQYTGNGPRDTEDLALSPDGKTLWIADVGDNPGSSERRSNVVLWTMPTGGGSRPVLHRVAYPQGKHYDAEALLIGPDNVPIIITKTPGKAELFSPAASLKSNNETPVPLKKVGDVPVPKTETDNPFGAVGRLTVTGAARAPDGGRVILRTYADAFEYDVSDGDVVKALTSGEPRVTPLETDQFGEAISYSADGKTLVTVSDLGSLGDNATNDLLRYTPSQDKPKDLTGAGAPAGASGADGRSWSDSLTIGDLTWMVAAVGILGALLVGAGILGIVLSRRRAAQEGSALKDGDPAAASGGRQSASGLASVSASVDREMGYDDAGWDRRPGGYDEGYRSGRPDDDYQPAGTTYGSAPRPQTGGVYGGSAGKGGGGKAGGKVYGGGGGSGGGGGNVYGGGGQGRAPQEGPPIVGGSRSSGGVYGRPQGGGMYPPDEAY